MKNRTNFLGIIALVAIIGFVGVSCGSSDDFGAPTPNQIPAIEIGELPAMPANFFPTDATVLARFPVPTSAADQRAVLTEIVRQAGLIQWLMNDFVFGTHFVAAVETLNTAVGAPGGGEVNLAALTPEQVNLISFPILSTDPSRAGTISSDFNAVQFRTLPDSTGSSTFTADGVRFQVRSADTFDPGSFPSFGEFDVHPNTRFYGAVRMGANSSMNWNRNRITSVTNYGYAVVLGFVISNRRQNVAATGDPADYQPHGFSGYIIVRSGTAGRGESPRAAGFGVDGSLTFQGHIDYTNVRDRSASSTTLLVEFFDRARAPVDTHERAHAPPTVTGGGWSWWEQN